MKLRNIGRGIAALLFIPTVFTIVFSVFVLAAVPAMANPDNVKKSMVEQNIYGDLVPVVLPAILDISENVETSIPLDFREIRDNMTPDDWRAVANELVPPDWVQEQAENTLDSVYAYLGGAPQLSYQLDMRSLGDRLVGDPGERAIRRITTLARPCDAEEVAAINNLATTQPSLDQLPVCRPANPEDTALLQAAYQDTFADLRAKVLDDEWAYSNVRMGSFNILDQIDINDRPEADEINEVVLETRLFFQTYELYQPTFYLLPLIMLSLIVMFAVHSLKGFTRWMSIIFITSAVLLLVGMLALSVGIITVPIADGQPTTDLSPNIPPEVLEIQERFVNGVLRAAYTQIGSVVLPRTGVLMFIGVVLLGISFVAPGPQATVRLKDGASLTPTPMTISDG